MGLLRDPVATRSHSSWKNLATRYGRFCVQRRTEEGLSKNTKLRHRWFYVVEDRYPFRIIYSTYPSDFSDALPASSPAGTSALYSRGAAEGSRGTGSNVSGDGAGRVSPAVARFTTAGLSSSSSNNSEGIAASLLSWWSGKSGGGEERDGAGSAPSAAASLFFLSPFSGTAAGPMERFTVATSTQLSGILEAWGLLLEAWEPEEAELNVSSFTSPAMASPVTTHACGSGDAFLATAAEAKVPFFERWRRTYDRMCALCAERGLERRATSRSHDALIPTSSAVSGSGLVGTAVNESSPMSASPTASCSPRDSNALAASTGGGDVTPEHGGMKSFSSRRHVHLSDAYHPSDSPKLVAVEHFFDVLLMRVMDLLMWRDPQLTACCLGVLVSVYGCSAWASALRYLAGEELSSRSHHGASQWMPSIGTSGELPWSAGDSGWVSVDRVWWGAPLFMISVLAYPWTGEQQHRVITLTDREHLRSIDHALRWLSATGSNKDAASVETSEKGGDADEKASAAMVLVDVAKRVRTVLRENRLPISLLLLFNVVGAFSSWEAILVLFLWPTLIVGVSLAGIVVLAQCLTSE